MLLWLTYIDQLRSDSCTASVCTASTTSAKRGTIPVWDIVATYYTRHDLFQVQKGEGKGKGEED